MINNNIYALLIGVGDYKKIKIADLPSYRMDGHSQGGGPGWLALEPDLYLD